MSSDIQEFYKGKSVFITGATGFLGKVLVEKLLRSCPGIDQIFVLVRSKKGKDTFTRIDALFSGEIFENLSKQQPDFRQKVIGIRGDVMLDGLGIDPEDRKTLTEKVSVIFHAAATVRFDEVLTTAVAINVNGIKEIIDLARDCKRLVSLMHVSTAYSHCNRRRIEEKFYATPYEPHKFISVVNGTAANDLPKVTKLLLMDWPNTYTLTKAISEEVVRLNGIGLPICIFRPAIVTAAKDEPIPGWIDNVNGPSGVMVGVGCGLLRVMRGRSDRMADLVPVDLVVNSMIAISYKTAQTMIADEIPIYHYVSSPDNPISWQRMVDYCLEYGEKVPVEKAIWCLYITFVNNYYLYLIFILLLHFLPAAIVDAVCILTGRKPQLVKIYKKIMKVTEVLQFFSLRDWEFTQDNTKKLWKELSEKDKKEFPFDIMSIDWAKYYENECYGIRKYVIKEDLSTLPAAKKKYLRFKVMHRAIQLFLSALCVIFLYYVCKKFVTYFL